MKHSKTALGLLILAISLASLGLWWAFIDPIPMATVFFFSNNSVGYACFLNSVQNEQGGPYCMSDAPALRLPSNATVPYGKYSLIFFPFNTASNRTQWYATNDIRVTGWAPYDASSAYANVTIIGNGAIVVIVLRE